MEGRPGDAGYLPLVEAPVGQPLRMVSVWADKTLIRRLCDLGLPIGAVITIVHRQGGGGLVVERHETRLALGGDLARRIGVTPVEDESSGGEA